jgi:RnfABCDGE-type electron transport complex D subunit
VKIVRNFLDKINKKTQKGPLKYVNPLIEAVNTALFDPDINTSNAPHIRDANNNKRYIFSVVIAMMPILLLATWFYGLRVPLMVVFAYGVGAVVETIFAYHRKEAVNEGFLVTGMLFVLIFPVTTPLWIFAIAIIFGTIFGKEVFGGVGNNPFNPALVGRIFAMLSWPAQVSPSTYITPQSRLFDYVSTNADAVTTASPLSILKTGGANSIFDNVPLYELFWGPKAGAIGEISSFLIIIGGIYLILIKIINWRIPLAILVSSGITAFALQILNPQLHGNPLFHILSGGVLLGAFFMATDPVSSPDTAGGKWIYGIFIGVLIIVIRGFSPLLEGVMFSILLMNIFSPLIDEIFRHFRKRKERSYG